MWPRLVNAALGLWLMAAPAVLGYEGGTAADVHRVLGPLAFSAAVTAMAESCRPVRWVNLVLGALLVVLPWPLGFPRVAAFNGMAVGAVMGACALVRGRLEYSLGGGWAWLRGAHPRR